MAKAILELEMPVSATLETILKKHQKWLNGDGERADLSGADLRGAVLSRAVLRHADMRGANLRGANLSGANLSYVDLRGADLRGADLSHADLSSANLSGADLSRAVLSDANLSGANLSGANLRDADLRYADLRYADLRGADLSHADLSGADLRYADLRGANLHDAKGLVKMLGAQPGNYYWKRFNTGLCSNGYQFKIGLNELRPGEVFADDERVLCSYPGFHFASRSWCAANYPDRPLEALIRIPEDARINEPWASDGEASADKIEIIKVFDTITGKDVTDKYREGGTNEKPGEGV